MAIQQFIRQRGFMRWYERELMRGHSHLVLLILCALAVLGAIEAFGARSGADRLLMVASLLVAAGVGTWSLRRYLFHLMRAELIANQAVCPRCQVYGRWKLDTPADAQAPDDAGASMAVCCRACDNRWTIGW